MSKRKGCISNFALFCETSASNPFKHGNFKCAFENPSECSKSSSNYLTLSGFGFYLSLIVRTKIQRLFRFLVSSATTPLPSSKKLKMVTLLHGVYQSQFQLVEIFYFQLRYRCLQELWEKKAAISVPQREEASPDEHPLCLLYQGSEWGGRLWSNIAGCCPIKPL